MSYLSSLFKIRQEREKDVDIVDLADQEAFTRFISQPYYETFLRDLETMALTEGIGLTDGNALLKSVGKREAILDIVTRLRRKEKIIRERMRDDTDDED
jgi:hypothetical protein